jgi:hypothetical protein
MPITGDFKKLKALEKKLADLAMPKGTAAMQVGKQVSREILKVVKDEFARGVAPSGAPWQEKARGGQALESRKLPNAIRPYPDGLFILFSSRVPWFGAHQTGHVFPARAAGGQVLTFNKKGRLLKASRIGRQKFVFDVAAKAHEVRQRMLPARPIHPEPGEKPPAWVAAIARGADTVLQRWYASATGG